MKTNDLTEEMVQPMQPITFKEVLTLFDRVTGYGIDRHSRTTLDKLNETTPGKHITTPNATYTIIHDYIEQSFAKLRKPSKSRDDILWRDGSTPNETYHKPDVIAMLEHKPVQEILARHFRAKTVIMGGVFVPAVVADSEHPYHPDYQEVYPW